MTHLRRGGALGSPRHPIENPQSSLKRWEVEGEETSHAPKRYPCTLAAPPQQPQDALALLGDATGTAEIPQRNYCLVLQDYYPW